MHRSINDPPSSGGPNRQHVALDLGPDRFICRLETTRAPNACAALLRLLPLTARLQHGRWSGEAGWAPLGPGPFDVPSENSTDAPEPGEILFYSGGVSEPELLVPYGPSRFACVHGPLSGSHLLTVENDLDRLAALGADLLRHGDRPLHLYLMDLGSSFLSESPSA